MQEVSPGIYRLGSAHHNFYVVAEGGKATIVDSGGSRDFSALEQALAALSLRFDDVEVMLITHAHTDHMGSASATSKRGVTVKGHSVEVPVLSGRRPISQIRSTRLPYWKPATWAFAVAMLRAGAAGASPVDDVESVEDGEALDVPGRPSVIHTPGHTPGHAAYFLAEAGVLFTGDSLVTRNPVGGRRGPRMIDEPFHADPTEARRSLSRYTALDAHLLLPGHGDPWRGRIADAVSAALA